jgi:hypothetical protein
MTFPGVETVSRFFRSPEVERLTAALDAAEIDLASREANQDKTAPPGSWIAAAKDAIARARKQFATSGQYQAAWRELKVAERAVIEDPTDDAGAESLAVALRREAEGVGGRRGQAMTDLLCDDKGGLRPTIAKERARIIQAAALRDDHYDTQYYRIELRRRHLMNLFILLLAALVVLLGFTYCNRIELFNTPVGKTYNGHDRLLAVLLLGMLGASLSVAQTIVATDMNTKVTVQRVGAFMVWMRPIIGATAAVIAYALLLANAQLKVFFEGKIGGDDFAVIAVIAIVAGFSERFIVGALNNIADTQAKKS